MKPLPKKILVAAGGLLALYAGSYLILSCQGRYEPLEGAQTNVTSFAWCPRGFVDSDQFTVNRTVMMFFFPVWMADNMAWHTAEELRTGKYPVRSPAGDPINSPEKK